MLAPNITNDGYQYLDAASNLASGECLCTKVVMFDEQVAYGRIPVPFTHFAPGYPLLVAALSSTGIRAENAGYILSALAYLAVIWLIWDIGINMGARVWIVGAFSLLWIAHATALYYAATVATESIFTACLAGIAALIVRDIRAGSSHPVLTASIGVVAGLSYWLRYPGLFLAFGAGLYLIVAAWRIPRARIGALLGLIAAAALVGSITIRNAVDSGSWRGGFSSAGGRHKLGPVIADTIRAFTHFVTGDRIPVRINFWIALFALSVAVLVLLAIRALIRRQVEPGSGLYALAWTMFIAIAYAGGIFASTLATIAGDLPRYYFPALPLVLACLAVVCSRIRGAAWSVALCGLVLSTAAMQWRNAMAPSAPPDWILTRTYLSETLPSGETLLNWLASHDGPNEPILAVEGQALHYILQRPVVAVIPARDTTRRTDEQGFRQLMRQSRTKYILVLPGAPPDRILDQTSYAFLQSVASGDAPSWLKPAVRTHDAAVYECMDCAR